MRNANGNRKASSLSAAIRGGDQAAFAAFYEDQLLSVVGVIQKIVRDRAEALDIAQDAFAKLWQQREQIDPQKSLDAFLRTMAVNVALDTRRRKQIHAQYYREQVSLHDDENNVIDEEMLTREFQRKVELIISRMPPRQREGFLLSRKEGLSHNKIAEQMGISPNTVRNHVVNALYEIRSQLPDLAHAVDSRLA